ncbi:chemotaxis protein CheV [Bermanella marisrubri]|uniref:Chemotaxis protein CheV n=1 Tax=Bermanella marisrubri TaxID=207949 RepID=Q1N4T0_9GAMM|nr:chemotaxis protein CheV [Bermanella marisrubri]EAT13348.1 chemotaxis protein CheV [Oceanobacter sp. RED65] [Bermanella marisrubri]QIZ84104.1 chemotaxis protein CheV [Bermanella marisrubri]
MSGILTNVDSRTKLVGQNRLELLLFYFKGRSQWFAINVFKIQEVLRMVALTHIPDANPVVKGVAHLRGRTVPVVDLSAAIGMGKTEINDDTTIIVTEYNGTVQAFMVAGVERIVNMNWEEIQPPPKGAGRSHYLTAITKVDDKIVEIIDVEKVLAEIVPYVTDVSEGAVDLDVMQRAAESGLKVLAVDDSAVARSQIRETLGSLGLTVIEATDGREGLNLLKRMASEDEPINSQLLMLITDAEMPNMDGYKLTTEVRSDPRLKELYVVLHTSLSGNFNEAMVKKVGCSAFLSKFQPDGLAKAVEVRAKQLFG